MDFEIPELSARADAPLTGQHIVLHTTPSDPSEEETSAANRARSAGKKRAACPRQGKATIGRALRSKSKPMQRRESRLDSTAVLKSFFESDVVMMSVSEILQEDEDGVFITSNGAAARHFKRTLEEMAGLRWSEAGLPLEVRRHWIQHCLEAACSGKPSRFEGCRDIGSKTFYYEATAFAVPSPAGAQPRFTNLVEDITARKEAERGLLASRQKQKALIDCMPAMIGHVDAERRYVFCNKFYFEFTGFTPEDLIGKTLWEALGDEVYQRMRPYVDRVLAGERVSYESAMLHHGSRVHHMLITYAPEFDATGSVVGYFLSAIDITDRKTLEQERETLLNRAEGLLHEAVVKADSDPLTGLLNHRAFYKRLEEEADRCLREGTSMAVAVMDLDNFKFFNDAYGHAAGDQVLRSVAEALQRSCRSYDVLARFGGDEFAMLLPGVESEAEGVTSEGIAKRLCGALEAVGFRPQDAQFTVPILLSAGVALFPAECPTRAEAIELADARLRRSKLGAGDEEQTPAERLSLELAVSTQGFAMLNALVTAVDVRDRYTRRHSEDVMRYSLEIAGELGLSEAQQKTIAAAALLHDVGKIGVPDKILRKPGQLTESEFDAVRQHAQMGAAIVAVEPNLGATLDAIRHHHERWDGAGYPHRLTGCAIPFDARIMAVADAFSAMTTDRPYRQGMPEQKALEILNEGAGTQWDPECVAAFQRVRCRAQLPKPAAAPPPIPPAEKFRLSGGNHNGEFGPLD